MEDVVSQDSVLQAEELPVIEDLEEKSHLHRAEKMANKLIQSEALGEFDLFGSAIKLNFNGEENYKTEFGGLVWLAVMLTTIALTGAYMFPNGLVVNSKITEYSVLQNNGQGLTVFDYTDTFLTVYIYNSTCNCRVTGAAFEYLLQSVTAWQTVNGQKAGQLDLVKDVTNGQYILRNSGTNGGATIYGSDSSNSASIHLQFKHCGLFDVSATYGMCLTIYNSGIAVGIDVTTFQPTTGDLVTKTSSIPLTLLSASNVLADVTEFTTNNKFLGYIANVLSYEIDYYNIFPAMYTTDAFSSSSTMTIYDSTLSCINADYSMNDKCSTVDIIYSGTTNVATEMFDDITAPLLFFLSVSQTLFFLTSLAFLRNYANNAFKLRLADTLVFISDPSGRHYNFKDGPIIFLTCFLHNHFLIQLIDVILYRCFQTHTRRFFPLRAQMAMDMIEYGQKCMTDSFFYSQLNDMYSQENAQPAKIIFDYDKEEKEEEEEEDEPESYFDDEVSDEAFRRMCEEHEYYSVGRKKYLRDLLLETDKKYKLVLMAQKMFEGYCQRVRAERHCKEIELPVAFQNEELSGVSLKKQNQY